jgi:osmotically-inducible protein OsmY
MPWRAEVEMQLMSEDLRMRVLNALHWDLAVPRDRLGVDVKNGWVTVSGMVDLPYQRTCAESDAKSVPGVVGVTNLIRLADAQSMKSRREETARSQH